MGTKKTVRKRRRVEEGFKRQGGACYWCGLPMILTGNPNSVLFATYEHLEPKRAIAGSKEPMRKWVVAHRVCNNTRGYKDAPHPSAFERVMKAIPMQVPGWQKMERMDRAVR